MKYQTHEAPNTGNKYFQNNENIPKSEKLSKVDW